MPEPPHHASTVATLRKAALALPETREDHPWGECAFKVREKVFLFLGESEGSLRLSFKLPESREFALLQSFAQPTGYGLGRSGWVTASFAPGEPVPLPLLLDWLEESFCAVAPKRVAAALGQKPGPTPPRRRR